MDAITGETPLSYLETAIDQAGSSTREPELSVDVYLRSLSPPFGTHGTYQSNFDALSRLSETGELGDLRISVWGDRICLCENCTSTRTGRAILDNVEAFEQWASEADEDIQLPFHRRHLRSIHMESDRDVILFPQVLLAVYDGSSLLAVFPHSVEDTTYSVADGVAAIEQTVAASPRSVTTE